MHASFLTMISIELTSLNVQPNSFIHLSLHPLSIDLLTYLLKECSDGVLYVLMLLHMQDMVFFMFD